MSQVQREPAVDVRNEFSCDARYTTRTREKTREHSPWPVQSCYQWQRRWHQTRCEEEESQLERDHRHHKIVLGSDLIP